MSPYLSVRSAGSCLTLEVISGPSRGVRCFAQSTNTSRLPLTLGRVSPSDLVVKDSEVSGKHAMINWNLNVSLHKFFTSSFFILLLCCIYGAIYNYFILVYWFRNWSGSLQTWVVWMEHFLIPSQSTILILEVDIGVTQLSLQVGT